MWIDSLNLSPLFPVLSTRSLPAKSTKWNLEVTLWWWLFIGRLSLAADCFPLGEEATELCCCGPRLEEVEEVGLSSLTCSAGKEVTRNW